MAVFIRPFKVSDLSAFVPIEPMTTDEVKDLELAKAIEDSSLAVTGIRDGKIVGCGGVHPIDDEQGEIWLRLSKDCLKHRIDTLRWLRDGLKIIEETFPFRQLNVVVQCSYKRGQRLAERFGFKQTEIKDKYVIYSKLVKE